MAVSPIAGLRLDACGGTAARAPAAIRLDGARIAAVSEAEAGPEAAGRLLMPPLANAHDHARGVRPISLGGFDLPLELWLLHMSGLPKVDPYLVAAAALGRQAAGGLGAVMVHYTRPQDASRVGEELVTVAKAARDVGVRVAVAAALRDRNPLGYGPDEELLKRLDPADRELVRAKLMIPPASPAEQVRLVDELADMIGDDPLVTVQYGPYGLEWCSDALLSAVAERSALTGRRVHMHLLESRVQREYLDHAFAGAPVRHLDRLGLLTPRLSVAHAVWLRPDEMDLLAERGVTVSVNTSSNLTIRNGVAPVAAMQRAGVPLAMGLDGFSVDDDDDGFRELRLNYMLHRGVALDPGLPAGAWLRAACHGGRHSVCGLPERPIEADAPADLAVIDRAAYAGDLMVDADETGLLLHRATARHVERLIVAGREIVRGGRVLGVDLDAVHRELTAQVRHGADGYRSWCAVTTRVRERIGAFYAAGLHRCG